MSELVTDYLERATPLGLRFDMWWHLVRCPACRNYYDQMRKTVQLLRRPVATPPSPAAASPADARAGCPRSLLA